VVLLVSLNTIAPLLESNPVPMRGLFLGMIAASVLVPLRMMHGRFRPLDSVLLVVAAVVAFYLTGLPPSEVSDPPLWAVSLAAAVAVNALVLPGVSGSTLLVLMGLYVPVQHAVDDRDLAFVGAFLLGAAIGLASFVKLLRWLLEHRRHGTMAVLAGLMIGALRALWPCRTPTAACSPRRRRATSSCRSRSPCSAARSCSWRSGARRGGRPRRTGERGAGGRELGGRRRA
jgi:putative membrane protein